MKKLALTGGVLFGLILLLGALLETRRFTLEKDWPKTQGIIVDAKLFEAEGSSWLELKYDFDVEGERVTDDGTLDVRSIDRVPDEYREGQPITVHYDPKDPTRTYLEFAGYTSPAGLAIMGSVVLAICAPFAFGWIKTSG